METKSTSSPAKKSGYFGWLDSNGDEFQNQVANHDRLSITKSSRGIAVLTICALLALSIAIIAAFRLFSTDFIFSFADVFFSLIFYVPLLYFTYRSHLWAMYGLGLFYFIDKVMTIWYGLQAGYNPNIGSIIFLIVGIVPILTAIRVEQAYRNKSKNSTS